MRGAKSILALALAVAGASALAYNGGYENHYTADVAGYAGYGNDAILYAELFVPAAAGMVFAQCKALGSIDLAGQNIPAIGNASFAYCGVPKLTIPSCVHSVGYISFGGCSNLTEVSCDSWNWADGTENLEDKEPFRDCFKLKTLRVSGDAAEPPTSFDVTEIFTELTTVYCPASETNDWETAYPTLTIVGVPENTSTSYGLLNGTHSGVFSAASPEGAAEIASAMTILLTEEDEAAGLDVMYLRAVVAAAPAGGGSAPSQGGGYASTFDALGGDTGGDDGYYAYVDVNPDTVSSPAISSMSMEQLDDGVVVTLSVNSAIRGLWYGCEVKDSLSDPAFANDLDSFRRAPLGGIVVVTCTNLTEGAESAFYRVKVKASKPTE